MLETSGEDFESTDDLYEAIGEVLHEMEEDKSEKDIRYKHVNLPPRCFFGPKQITILIFCVREVCEQILRLLRPDLDSKYLNIYISDLLLTCPGLKCIC